MSNLYEEIGGLPALELAVERFSARVWSDPELTSYFAGMELQKLKSQLIGFLDQALGDSYRGPGRLRIEARHFDRVATHLAATLRELGFAEALVNAVMRRVAPVSGRMFDRGRARRNTAPAKVWAVRVASAGR